MPFDLVPVDETPKARFDLVPVEDESPETGRKEVGRVGTFVKNAAQALTFNTADEIDAGLTAAKRALVDGKDFGQEYASKVAYNRAADAQDNASNPKSAMAGQVTGAVLGGIGAPVKGAATVTGRIAQGIGLGAVTGAASGAGGADGDVIDRAIGAVKGAGYGAAGGAAGAAAGEIVGAGVKAARGVKAPAVKTGEDRVAEYLAGREALKAVNLPADEVQMGLVNPIKEALKHENPARYGRDVQNFVAELDDFGRNGVNANSLESFRQDLNQLPSKFAEPIRKAIDDFYEVADLPDEFRRSYAIKRQGEKLEAVLTTAGDSLTKQRNAINRFVAKEKGLTPDVKQALLQAGKANTKEGMMRAVASVTGPLAGMVSLGITHNPLALGVGLVGKGLTSAANRSGESRIGQALETVQAGGGVTRSASLAPKGAVAGGLAANAKSPEPEVRRTFRISVPGQQPYEETVTAPKAVSDTLVDRIIGVESGGRADAKNPNSSARGAGQFIKSTWLDLMKGEPEAEGKSPREILALRDDKDISRRMVQKYADKNASVLTKRGVQPTDATIYLAHVLDGPVAARLVKASPETPALKIVGKEVVAANPSIFRGKTVGQVLAWAERKTRA